MRYELSDQELADVLRGLSLLGHDRARVLKVRLFRDWYDRVRPRSRPVMPADNPVILAMRYVRPSR
jgi:hypothetical protein